MRTTVLLSPMFDVPCDSSARRQPAAWMSMHAPGWDEPRKRDEEDIRYAKAQCDSEVHQLLSGTICGPSLDRNRSLEPCTAWL